jgi:hypothetical protein
LMVIPEIIENDIVGAGPEKVWKGDILFFHYYYYKRKASSTSQSTSFSLSHLFWLTLC